MLQHTVGAALLSVAALLGAAPALAATPATTLATAPSSVPAAPAAPALPTPHFQSAHALVIDDTSGEVLFEKDAGVAAPIASMTKLLTAMVVLDAKAPADEEITITEDDLDHLKGTWSGVPVGARLTRAGLLQVALMSSDNHAAHALARTYPGGLEAFSQALQQKIGALGLTGTHIEEPTGLSPANQATAHDMARIVKAAGGYPAIVEATSQPRAVVMVNGRPRSFHNTNHLVGQPGWEVNVSKTGFIQEAGRCLTMELQAAGRKVLVVLMGARGSAQRTLDALNIHRLLTGETTVVARATPAPRVRHPARVKLRRYAIR